MSYNGLSFNRLSYNGMSYNRLSYNGLPYNGLIYNRLCYSSIAEPLHILMFNWVLSTSPGRESLQAAKNLPLFFQFTLRFMQF